MATIAFEDKNKQPISEDIFTRVVCSVIIQAIDDICRYYTHKRQSAAQGKEYKHMQDALRFIQSDYFDELCDKVDMNGEYIRGWIWRNFSLLCDAPTGCRSIRVHFLCEAIKKKDRALWQLTELFGYDQDDNTTIGSKLYDICKKAGVEPSELPNWHSDTITRRDIDGAVKPYKDVRYLCGKNQKQKPINLPDRFGRLFGMEE